MIKKTFLNITLVLLTCILCLYHILVCILVLFCFCHVLFVFCHESADNNLDTKGKKKPRKTTQAGGAGVDLAKITAEQQVKLHKERDERIAAVKTASAEKEAAGAVDSGGSASSPGDIRAEEVRRDGSGHTGLVRSVRDTRGTDTGKCRRNTQVH